MFQEDGACRVGRGDILICNHELGTKADMRKEEAKWWEQPLCFSMYMHIQMSWMPDVQNNFHKVLAMLLARS